VNPLERGGQVHFMAEFQELLDFPPAPKLDVFGKLDPAKATESELRGFFAETMINGRLASADGPIKTFPLRGLKDSPPYLHDDRLMTIEDTVEFFNVVLALKLTASEKTDLVAFLRTL
jgi:cytochrome c peroxidase